MKTEGLFITGTDTGVGKTMVSAAIIRLLMRQGLTVGAMKPFETGCIAEVRREASGVRSQDRSLIPADGMFLREMAEMDDPIDLVTPVRLEHPLAPMVAAKLERVPIFMEQVFAAYRRLSERYSFMVVEGAGGLLVPLLKNERGAYSIADLIRDLAFPVVVVARPSLGTINHTLLTVRHALTEGLTVKGVIINHSSPPEGSLAEETSYAVLRELCPVPVIGVLPFIGEQSAQTIESVALASFGQSLFSGG